MVENLDFINKIKEVIEIEKDYSNLVMKMGERQLLTSKEFEVVSNIVLNRCLFNLRDYYNNNSYFTFNELKRLSTLDKESLKGVLGSLIKKGVIFKEDSVLNYESNNFGVSCYIYGIDNDEFKEITKEF